jgi:hypothetical protein
MSHEVLVPWWSRDSRPSRRSKGDMWLVQVQGARTHPYLNLTAQHERDHQLEMHSLAKSRAAREPHLLNQLRLEYRDKTIKVLAVLLP